MDELDGVVVDWVGEEPTAEEVASFASFAETLRALRASPYASPYDAGATPCEVVRLVRQKRREQRPR